VKAGAIETRVEALSFVALLRDSNFEYDVGFPFRGASNGTFEGYDETTDFSNHYDAKCGIGRT
jgi:hypothetical protein